MRCVSMGVGSFRRFLVIYVGRGETLPHFSGRVGLCRTISPSIR
jgi:hypothetical protein